MFKAFFDLLFPPSHRDACARTISQEELVSLLEPRHATDDGDVLTLFHYSDATIRSLIHSVKYGRNKDAAKLLGTILADVLLEELYEKRAFENFDKPLFIPIPLSKRRMMERGFNQSALIGHYACTQQTLELNTNCLRRTRHTKQQTQLKNADERQRNVEKAFAVVHPERVAGRNVVLIDDVTTTGATLQEARKVLYAAGARQVLCVALAH